MTPLPTPACSFAQPNGGLYYCVVVYSRKRRRNTVTFLGVQGNISLAPVLLLKADRRALRLLLHRGGASAMEVEEEDKWRSLVEMISQSCRSWERDARTRRRWPDLFLHGLGFAGVMLIYFWVCNCNAVAAWETLRRAENFGGLGKRCCSSENVALFEQLFLEVPLHIWIHLVDPETETSSCKIFSEAWTLKTEWEVAEWCNGVNDNLGLAPSSTQIYEQYDIFLRAAPAALRLGRRCLHTDGANKVWAYRWRQRWEGRIESIAIVDADDVVVLRQKATWGRPKLAPPWTSNWFTIWLFFGVVSGLASGVVRGEACGWLGSIMSLIFLNIEGVHGPISRCVFWPRIRVRNLTPFLCRRTLSGSGLITP
jgi:hypothetical protein